MNSVIEENGNISAYKVNMVITFVLEEGDQIGWIVQLFLSNAPCTKIGRFLLSRKKIENTQKGCQILYKL